jgi:hypothetical protein
MQIETSDPAYMDSLRAHLQQGGCPSERRTDEILEVRVLRSGEAPLTEAEMRTQVFGQLRAWCADNPGVKANLLS